MTTKRLALLLAVILGGFSLVYLLPHQLGFQPIGIELQLPPEAGVWQGRPVEVTQKEHNILGADTEFARRLYARPGGGANVLVSVVLAGQDMMTGLHRPESCLIAQGWNPGGSSAATVEVPGFGKLPVTRLRNSRKIQLRDEPTAPFYTLENVCYYWFVGATRVVPSHEQRVWTDMIDRVLRGYNQRWAMVLVSGEITAQFERNGRTEEQTDRDVREVIAEVAPTVIKPGVH